MNPQAIAVVGAGIAGLASAVELRRAGHPVDLYDKATAGSGSSSGAMGTITPFSDHEADESTVALGVRNLERLRVVLREIASTLNLDCGYRDIGTLELFFSEDERSKLEQHAASLRRFESGVSILDAGQARALEPGLVTTVLGAAFYPNEPELSARGLLTALTEYVAKIGCRLVENCPVRSIVSDPAGVIISHGRGSETYKGVVVAAGLGHNDIAGLTPLRIEAVIGEIAAGRISGSLVPNHNLYYGRGFIAPKADGRILFGSNYDPHVAGMDEDPRSIRLSSLRDMLDGALAIYPSVTEVQIDGIWKNWRPKHSSGRPVIFPDVSGRALIVNGLYGLGFTLSFAIAESVAEFFSPRSSGTLLPQFGLQE